MRIGIVISLLLHAGILAWALLSISSTKSKEIPRNKPIVVDIRTLDDVTRIKRGAPKAKPKKPVVKPKPPQKAKARPTPPKPQRTAAVEATRKAPTPDPIADILKKAKVPKPAPRRNPKPEKPVAKPKPKPKPVARAKPKPKPPVKPRAKPRPKPKKPVARKPKPKTRVARKDNFTDDIFAVLNKVPDATPGPKSKPVRKPAKPAKVESERGQANGTTTRLTISERDFLISAMQRQIERCFSIFGGARGIDKYLPVIAFSLKRDGALTRLPKVMNTGDPDYSRTIAEAAERAVLDCQPYELPAHLYAHWKYNEITFDPRSRVGG